MLQIFNTLTRKKEPLVPMVPGKIGMYVCGVTVYDFCHLGHARTYSSADIVVRYLRWRGYDVRYVRNITDIDDKIIKRANEAKKPYSEITTEFITAMHADFAALGFAEPDDEPCASDYIPEMIRLIERIIKNGHAYVGVNGDVYFDVRSHQSYGCLSHHNIDQLESGARVEISEVKRDPLDFALWKIAKPDEPSWPSPWGHGRPGWHIECSAMSIDLLGETFDIHAGGRDLIFPHHENELAQSVAATSKPFANLWMHGGFLQIDKEKMSKSLGNFVTIRDLLQDHSAEVLRYLFITSHYRSPLVYSENIFSQAHNALSRLYTALRFLPSAQSLENSVYEARFIEAMDDDFNTPVAFSILFELAHEVQRLRDNDLTLAAQHAALLKNLGAVLGILQQDPERFFQNNSAMNAEQIEELIAARNRARASKDWSEADRIRQALADLSISIEDGPQGTTWKVVK